MCGRYVISRTPEQYRAALGYLEQPNFPPRHNVAPTQPVPIVTADREGARHFRLVRWGFLPTWVKDPKAFPLIINARAETLLEKATFRSAVKRRRCIFLSDGFYEWRREGRAKAPYLIRRRAGGILPFAGLWETYADATGGEIDTAAIVTTDANGTMAGLHDRMPAILDEAAMQDWLAGEAVEAEAAVRLARPCPDDWLEAFPVSARVNKVANDDPSLLEPLPREDLGPTPARAGPAKAPRSTDEDEQERLL